MEKPVIKCSAKAVIEPEKGCEWADTMVLNPAVFAEEGSDTLHMLFRATGPWHEKNLRGLSDPYPIFLGYAVSGDNGESWNADFSRPALSPKLEYEPEKLYIKDMHGRTVPNYANGCVEDPRVFTLEGKYYLTAACRMFPPGPYWQGDKRRDNVPDWALEPDNPFGSAAYKNDTTTVLYRMEPEALKKRDYDNAFRYVCPLTDGKLTDNRDVFFFPEKLKVNGKMQYIMLHRPEIPDRFACAKGVFKPSVMIAAAENMEDFITEKAEHKLFAVSEFDWEEERIGASFPPIRIDETDWLVSYHGKSLPEYGYTQSFMIVREQTDGFPEIVHRCSARLLYAKQDWELPDLFRCPCIFTTGGLVRDDKLIMGYGAADQKIGMAWACFDEIVDYVRTFDEHGRSLTE